MKISLLVIQLTDKQTYIGDNITSLAEVTMCLLIISDCNAENSVNKKLS